MTAPQGIRTRAVGVVGCGTMGSGIAEACARAGYPVVVRVLDQDHAEAGRDRIGASMERAVRHGQLEDEARRAALGRISFVTDLKDIGRTDLVVEAIPERLEDKRALFAELAGACNESTILATNTSSLPVIDLGAAFGSPDRVVGLHFFNPAPVMRLVELAETVATTPGVLEEARAFAASLGKTVVGCKDRAGFVANLLLFPYLNEAVRLYDSGFAAMEDIDTAMRLGAGHPMGPLELVDLIGLDACQQILESLHRQFNEPRYAPSPCLRELVTAGFTGRKAGRGFYLYPDRDGPRRDERRPGSGNGGGAVRRLGVAGTGTVGSGVAESAARVGVETVCWGRSEASCERGREAVERSTARAVERGRMSEEERESLLGRLRYTSDLAGLAECDLVVEAIAEDLEAKRALFAALAAATREDAVLATATSSLRVIDLASASGRASRVLGLHFFNPVPAMRLVEVVRTVATEEEAMATALGLAARMGKTPVICQDRAGFIVNRLLFPYLNDAVRMVEQGYAAPEDVDAVMTLGCNHPIGPLGLLDLVGLDVALEILRSFDRELGDPSYAPAPLLEQMVRAGFLGRKTGRGLTIKAEGPVEGAR